MRLRFILTLGIILCLCTFEYGQHTALFPITVGGKSGYIDNSGKIVIRPKFDEARGFNEGLAPIRIGDNWGYINSKGEIVIEPQFFEPSPFNEGLAAVGVWFPRKKIVDSKVGFYSYIDTTGRLITDQRFDVAFDFSEGLADVLTADYKHVFIDRTGKRVFEFYTYESDFQNGLLLFKTKGNMPDSRAGFINKSGKVAIPATYNDAENFSEGLACAYTDKGAGYIDAAGRVAIDFRFTYCRQFSEGLAAVFVDDKYGFIDKTGSMVIPPQFPEVQAFSDGVAIVRVAENSRTLDKEERSIRGDTIVAFKDGAYGVIDRTGKFVVPPKFIQLGNFHNGLAWVNLGDNYIVHGDTDHWGYINKKGEIVWKSF